MSLRPKIVLTLLTVMTLYALTDWAIKSLTIGPSFHDLEEREAKKDVTRIQEAIDHEIEVLHDLCLSWSERDDTYEYVEQPNEAYVRNNLSATHLRNNRVDLLFVCALDGRVVWHAITDPDTDEPVSLRLFPTGWLDTRHVLLNWLLDAQSDSRCGLLLTDHKAMLVSARPIRRFDGGQTRGAVIIGRFLSDGLRADLSEQTKVQFDYWQLDGRSELGPQEREVLDEVTSSTQAYVVPAKDVLHVYSTFGDIQRRPNFLIRADVPREISGRGSSALRYALLSMIAACLIILLALLGLLQKIVLTPLSMLTRHAVRIGETEDFRAKLRLARGDELGILSREIDNMMERLEHARAELVKTARTAGMSEIATGILHNVGNVLNSVKVSASVVSERVRELAVGDLQKLTETLEKHEGDLAGFLSQEDRGQHMLGFLRAIHEHIVEQRTAVSEESSNLVAGIDHICELIKSQQNYVGRSDLVEVTSVIERIEEAVGITEKALVHDPGLAVVREFGDVPDVLVDRHKLLEILVNLIQNARQAMCETLDEPRVLTLRSWTTDEKVVIEVSDTGEGIPAQNLVKVFALGFTTKEKGHGYGLHTCANAAKEMGGTLTAHSEGTHRGATFRLELPLRLASNREAA